MIPRTPEQFNIYLDREIHLNKYLFSFKINELSIHYLNKELSLFVLADDIQKQLSNEDIHNQVKKIIESVIRNLVFPLGNFDYKYNRVEKSKTLDRLKQEQIKYFYDFLYQFPFIKIAKIGYFHAMATISDINNFNGLSTFRGFFDYEEEDSFSSLLLESNIKESDISNLITEISKSSVLNIKEEGLILDVARKINGTIYNRDEYEKELNK